MIQTIPIFIGYDPRERAATNVLIDSLYQHSSEPISITPLLTPQLEAKGIYTRAKDPKQSTAFSFTRFLVPHLMNYQGWAIFMDCDMLCKDDIIKLWDQRKAQFVCVIAIVGPGIPFETPKIFRAEVSGIISLEEKGDNGFGYDPIFISSIFQKTNAQLKNEEKDSISHRGLAIKKMTPLLEKMLI